MTDNIDDVNEFVKNCNLAQTKINLDNEIKFLKTHHAFWRNGNYAFTDLENTLGVIHIIRDPRNVITSVLNHFNKDDYVTSFTEKPTLKSVMNIGYFFFTKKYHHLFFKHNSFIEVLSYLVKNKKLKCYKHSGIHITINTIAELEYANKDIKKIFS